MNTISSSGWPMATSVFYDDEQVGTYFLVSFSF
jgi:hypothetical protein